MRLLPLLVLLCPLACGPSAEPPPNDPPAPAAQPKPPPPAPKPFAGEWRAALKDAAIPEVPAGGEVRGEPFTVERAELENGVLTLRQGKDFFADREFKIFVFAEKGEIPAGRTWTVETEGERFGHPHIHVGYRRGQDMPQHDMFMGGYAMRLELGAESGKRIAGKIWLCVEAEASSGPPEAPRRSWVAGTFTAQLKGFILRNGQADRTEDAIELLPWLLAEHLREKHPGKAIEITDTHGGWMTSGQPTGTGQSDAAWSLDGAAQGWLKARYLKRDGQWALANTWPGEQIPEAHPASPPDLKAPEAIPYLVAGELERQHPRQVLHTHIDLSPRIVPNVAATCDVRWEIAGQDDSAQQAQFLCRWSEAGWTFDRRLGPKERFNARTGAVTR